MPSCVCGSYIRLGFTQSYGSVCALEVGVLESSSRYLRSGLWSQILNLDNDKAMIYMRCTLPHLSLLYSLSLSLSVSLFLSLYLTCSLSFSISCSLALSRLLSLLLQKTTGYKCLDFHVFQSPHYYVHFLFSFFSLPPSVPDTANHCKVKVKIHYMSEKVNMAQGTQTFAKSPLTQTRMI